MNDVVTVVPWGLHPLSKWVVDELERRAGEYGQNPDAANNKQYSGPRTAWVRFFSNGISKLAPNLDGFVMGGVYGFNDSYGFNNDQKITIGVDARGNPHKIQMDRSITTGIRGGSVTRADFPHRPPPNIESISAEAGGGGQNFPGACRKITINWKCHSLAQLNYLAPYFLTPRITCLVEWGWNNYDNISLVDLTDLDWINNMFVDPSYTLEYLKESKGNYDAGIGFIIDYGYKLNEAGGYDCHTTITNANRLIEGEQIHNKEVTIKQGDAQLPVKSFKEFVQKNLESIDTGNVEYHRIRRELKLGERIFDADKNEIKIRDNIDETTFRIDQKNNNKNVPNLWLRMDLVENIINAFFQVTMENPKTAIIRKFDISQAVMVANPFLKSSNENVLVPNQYAPRFTYENVTSQTNSYKPEDAQYTLLFREKIEAVSKEYEGISDKFDNLKEIINKSGESFPVYRDNPVKDEDGNLAQTLDAGYWGNLKDLFINAKYFRKIVENNDSVLKMIEQLLQGINEALSQICQLKLIPAEYGNSTYSVYDENLPGISKANDAARLPKITLGSISSAYIKAAAFDVKISSEMMSQLVMQSANPQQDINGNTSTNNVKATPISNRYSAGDRLYRKGELKTTLDSVSAPPTQTPEQIRKEQAERQALEEEARKKKRQLRSEDNKDTFLIYYELDESNPKVVNRYYLAEKNKDFLNYVLTLPNKKAPYLNNAIMPGTTLTLEFLGISGIDYLSQFVIDHAPETYNYANAVWQIVDIKQTVEDKNWTTTVTAQVRPLTIL